MSHHASAPNVLRRPERGDGWPVPPISALAFDLDGTIHLGWRILPGARELLDRLAAHRVPFLFATNNSSRTAAQYAERLTGLGLPGGRGAVVTSNDVAITHLARQGWRRPHLIATPQVEEEYRSSGLSPTTEAPDCVLLTFDTSLTYDKLRVASALVRSGVPYLATHPDVTCPTPGGPIPDCGSFIALLEAVTGRRPTILGKPKAAMASIITERLGCPAREIAFVGDRLYTDVRMANDHGLQAVLTLTGETRRDDLDASSYVPDLVVETLDDLATHLERLGTLPESGGGVS